MANIRLKQFYSGRKTNEQVITPGVYDEHDPRLFGLADYLVNTLGFAEYVGGESLPIPTPAPVPPTPEGAPANTSAADLPPEATDYESMKFELLRALVAKRELQPTPSGANGSMKKDDLIAALKADDEAKAKAAEEHNAQPGDPAKPE